MLIALRTCPNHGRMNFAERCISALNLALQHKALARNEMENLKLLLNTRQHFALLEMLANVKSGLEMHTRILLETP